METIPFIRSPESSSLNYTFTIIQVESLNATNDIMIQHEQGSASYQSDEDMRSLCVTHPDFCGGFVIS
ncbi:unnamed protein product [Citrullus colocynthis]|uniref:Uncharacterized protein n=1 Tax=Citrullus colocynthis TaxID=252529 RepID=A0ABP0XPI7_9ROSI